MRMKITEKKNDNMYKATTISINHQHSYKILLSLAYLIEY